MYCKEYAAYPMFTTLQANGTQKLSTACDVAFITLNIYSSCLKEEKKEKK